MFELDIAIVGLACRLPGAANFAQLADLLRSEQDAVTEVPSDRWSHRLYLDPDVRQPGRSYTFAGGVLDNVHDFDAGFFGMSPREAANVDPQQRLLLELAHEALEDAGIAASRLSGSDFGVFVGGSAWDYATTKVGDIALMDTHSMQGMALSSMSNRISYVLNLKGPSLTVDTACSSSLVALDLACRSIASGKAAGALVGGVNMLLSPQGFVGFSRASMLSPSGRCHPFGDAADGYVRAEGGGILILKPLDQALRDGDPIRGVLKATDVNSDGRTSSFSVPSEHAQADLLNRIYGAAGIDPSQLSYIEAHGTGTPVGDPIEAMALGRAVGRQRAAPLPIGSVKSNIGHLEAASGMAGLLKALVVLEQRYLPKSLQCERLNPNIEFSDLNLRVVREAEDLGPGELIVGVNSFGFGGTNAHAVLASPPPAKTPLDSASPPPLLISAQTEEALVALAGRWRDALSEVPNDAQGAPLVRGAALAREHYKFRLAARGSSAAELATELEHWLGGDAPAVAAGKASVGQTAFVFSGNGSQWLEMGRSAFAANPAFRAAIEMVDASLAPVTGWSILPHFVEGSDEARLRHTDYAQPLLFAIQVACVEALASEGLRPQAVVGHSVGEVAAAWATGALSLEQACLVVAQRSRFQQQTHGHGGMAAINAPIDALQEKLAGTRLEIAAYNSNGSATIAGSVDALDAFAPVARRQGWAMTRLDLDYAFHAEPMDAIREGLLSALSDLRPTTPKLALASTVTGDWVRGEDLDGAYWWHNVREPVLFARAVDALIAQGVSVFVEIGPQPVLQSYIRQQLATASADGAVLSSLTRNDPSDAFAAIASRAYVAGADISQGPRFAGPHAVRGLPIYPWQRETHLVGATPEGIDIVNPTDHGPLIGFQRAEGEWTNHLSLSVMPWLAGHKVDGLPVFPAAAMIDIALTAGQTRLGAEVEIEDLEFIRPLVLDHPVETRATLTADGAFELSSRGRLSSEGWTTNARARLRRRASDKPLLSPMPATEGGATWDAKQFYQVTASRKLDYQDDFQIVSSAVLHSPDEVSVLFRLEAHSAAFTVVDPLRIDGALQAITATRSMDYTQDGDSVLPARIGRVRVLDANSRPIAAWLRLKRIGPRAHCADITLLGGDGAVVLEMLDVWFVRIRPGETSSGPSPFWLAPQPIRAPLAFGDEALPLREIVDELAPALAAQPDSVLLAEAFVDAALKDGRGGASDTQPAASGEPSPTPSAIWQALLMEIPAASAELALLACAVAPSGAPGSQQHLTRQLLTRSPSARAAAIAIESAVGSILTRIPSDGCVEVALIGAVSQEVLASLRTGLLARGIPARLVAATVGSDAPGEVLDDVADIMVTHLELEGQDVLQQLGGAQFDLIVSMFALSEGEISPAMLSQLLKPGGVLLSAEAEPGPVWTWGLAPHAMHSADSIDGWCDDLRTAGFETIAAGPLTGTLWTPWLLAGQKASNLEPLEAAKRPSDTAIAVVALDQAGAAERLADALRGHGACVKSVSLAALELGLAAPAAPWKDVIFTFAESGDKPLPSEMAKWAGRLAGLAASIASVDGLRIWLLVEARIGAEVSELIAALRRVMTNEGLDARAIFVDPALGASDTAPRIAAELNGDRTEHEVYLSASTRLTRRLQPGLPWAPPQSCGVQRLEIARPGMLGSLRWTAFDRPTPGPEEIVIEVEAAALNFRDVLWALGVLPDEALLEGFGGPTLGLECAGRVSAIGSAVTNVQVGDQVAAIAPWSLATHAVTRPHAVISAPGLAPADAATLPVAAITVVYALEHLARLQPGERVLIHGGAGAVGIMAIRLARSCGAEVFATAGSAAKREMLKLLGVDHVLDSRSAAFADEILRLTSGEGVDVVLNSLAGELMERSASILRPFGRFLEIGKRDLYEGNRLPLRPLRNNVSYFAIDADQIAAQRPQLAAALMARVSQLVHTGVLQPLPRQTYRFSEATDAFRLMQASGHVGKIVLIPDVVKTAEPPPAQQLVCADKAYVITGGLAGFGLETARWLAGRGARRLALIGRRGAETPGAEAAAAALLLQGCQVEMVACDVANADALATALAFVREKLGPIGGVVHAAMVIDDGLLSDLDAGRFETVLAPKVLGARALDQLTRDDPLDFFLLYSSVSVTIGNPGQANYAAANGALDGIARERQRLGLPALAIQWGPIADAGYLVRSKEISQSLERILGSRGMSAEEALDGLPELFAAGQPVMGLASLDWSAVKKQLPIGHTPYFERITTKGGGHDANLQGQLADLPVDEAEALCLSLLIAAVAEILRLPEGKVNTEAPISELGFDSLMALELRLAIEVRLGQDLPIVAVTGGASLKSIAARVVASARGQIDDLDAERMFQHEELEAETSL